MPKRMPKDADSHVNFSHGFDVTCHVAQEPSNVSDASVCVSVTQVLAKAQLVSS